MDHGNCYSCGFSFTPVSRQFFCCKREQRFCILCRSKNCPVCYKNTITKELSSSPRCKFCRVTSKKENDMLYEPTCDEYFCGRCIIQRTRKMNSSRHQNKKKLLPCGHEIERQVYEKFLENCCFQCGSKFDPKLDFELLNGDKCCFLCAKYERSTIQPFLMTCMSCSDVIRNFTQAGVVESDFLLCKKCVLESKIGEVQYEEEKSKHSKIDEFSVENEKNTFSKIEQAEGYNQGSEKKLFHQSQQEKMEQIEQKQNNQRKKEEEGSVKKVFIPHVNEYLEIQQVNQQTEAVKEEEGKQSSNKNEQQNEEYSAAFSQLKKTILHKFPSQKDRKMEKSKIKKHLSMDTYIEKMRLQIQHQGQQVVECPSCFYISLKSEAFPLLEDQNEIFYCRLCYTKVNKKQYLGFSSLNKSLVDSRKKRGVSDEKKQNVKEVQTPEKEKHVKLSGHFDTDSRTYTSLRPNVVRRQSTILSKEKCEKCKKVGEPVIKTIDRGVLCFPCYHKKQK